MGTPLIPSPFCTLDFSSGDEEEENIIDDDRKKNVFGMMMSLNMLIETGDGFDYTFNDFEKWAKQVGFSSTSLMPLTGPSSAAIAYK